MFNRILICLFLSMGPVSHAANEPQTISWPLSHSYVPIGFDDNDNVQVTVVGTFISTCYKVAPSHAMVVPESKTIYLEQSAYKYSGEMCGQLMVPFYQTIDVGIVPAGNYTLIDSVSGTVLGELPVKVSRTSNPDDYLYVPISDAYIRANSNTGKSELYLTGSIASRCIKLDRVEIHYYPDVIVVQPIAMFVANDGCEGKSTFEYSAPIPDSLKGTYLLHVRSMNGQAINKLVDLN